MSPPCVLCLGGHDPCGGAGLAADQRTIEAEGGHVLSLLTATTAQNSQACAAFRSSNVAWLQQQAETLLADIQPQAIKIGMLGSRAVAVWVADLLTKLPTIPVVLDPVLQAGGGGALASRDLQHTLLTRLLPHTTLITPNGDELLALSDAANDRQRARQLLDRGTQAVLISGRLNREGSLLHNQLIERNRADNHWYWPHRPHSYHGTGCSLAAAIAVRLAQGDTLPEAVQTGQERVWCQIHQAFKPGGGQYFLRNPDQQKAETDPS